MKQITILSAIFFSIMMIGCNSTKSINMSAVHESIEESNEQLDSAFQNGDTNSILNLFTDDCILSPIGMDDVIGRNENEKLLNRVFEYQKVHSYTLNIEELEVHNNTAFERGTYFWFSELKDGTVLKAKGRYFTLRKKIEPNNWIIHRLIENELPGEDKNEKHTNNQ